jgi:hypothetical protein
MKIHRFLLVVIYATLVLTALACNNDDDDLPQSVYLDLGNGRFTVHYPDGWIGNAANPEGFIPLNIIALATSQSILDSQSDELVPLLEPGAVGAFILAGSVEDDTATTATVIADFLESQDETEDSQLDLSEVESYDVDGRAAAIAHGTGTNSQGTAGVIIAAVEIGDVAAVMVLYVPADEVDQRLPLARAIIARMEFAPSR